jgi:hypothetical protein
LNTEGRREKFEKEYSNRNQKIKRMNVLYAQIKTKRR